MCGIIGVYHRSVEATADIGLVRAMTDRVVHRGPDDGGVVGLGPVALGHRRLSILDLSPAGHQPMSTADQRYWITFNGEIYNFLPLRADLEADGVRFRTRTDTEVLLELYRRDGDACLERLNGMFAFAIYDRKDHVLFLARDRLGKKPLYLWDDGDRVCFASELKSFHADPQFHPDIDPGALSDYLATLYIPDPRTVFRGVRRLNPAHSLTISAEGQRLRRYWHIRYRPAERWGEEDRPGLEAATDQLQALLTDAVRLRMISDVPLGAFLSGGVDSSVVVAEMSEASPHPVKTSTIGFSIREEDESPFAETVAQHFGCDHHTEPVEANAAALLETLVWHFDEPFADSSALPTYLLSQVTRKRVTVALSGDGGDESFGGYWKYAAELRERRVRSLLPPEAWNLLSRMARGLPLEHLRPWARSVNILQTLAEDPATAYYRTQSFMTPTEVNALLSRDVRARLRDYDPSAATIRAYQGTGRTDPLSAIQGTDLATSLPGDMLTKVDRMSMAHALEVRCPLLDHRLVEFALQLPPPFRLYRGEGKRVLKRVLERRLPRKLIDRPKHGFTIPSDHWFRGPLKGMTEDVLLNGGLKDAGLIDLKEVKKVVRQHQQGLVNRGLTLWSVLVLAMWYDRIRSHPEARWIDGAAPTVVETVGPWEGGASAAR